MTKAALGGRAIWRAVTCVKPVIVVQTLTDSAVAIAASYAAKAFGIKTGTIVRAARRLILDAVRESIGPGAADKIASLKKDAMAKRAEALLTGKGWLPAILR